MFTERYHCGEQFVRVWTKRAIAVFAQTFQIHCWSLFIAAILVGTSGCNFMDRDSPEIATPLGYGTVRVALPGCPSELPPVREDAGCGVVEIGKTIDHQDVCRMLTSLKRWVESASAADQRRESDIDLINRSAVRPGDWRYVRAVCVSDLETISIAHSPKPEAGQRTGRFLSLEADAPNRSLRMVVRMSEASDKLQYFAVPR